MSISLIIILLTCLISFKGFNDPVFFNKYKLSVQGVLKNKQWIRLISSGFLHGDIMHLLFNMYTFYFFAQAVLYFGSIFFIIVYFGSILTGNLLAIWIHRNNPYYSAIGASGGVSGIIFSAIILDSNISIGIFPLPFYIPGWIFAILYILYTFYGMKRQLGNIGHDAHLGGAIFGIFASLLYIGIFPNDPQINFNFFYLILILLPLIIQIFIFIIQKKKN